MNKQLIRVGLVLTVILFACVSLQADDFLEKLKPEQKVHGFRVVNQYDNSAGQAMGARLISEKYDFIIDLMRVQSVPQAFYWIKTPPTSSKGEPHACEHLLLGKGNLGRYVSALEDMALGNSSAYTAQTRTCYHFNTTAGEDTFYELFEAKLQALLHPDFTDEEIRREVCHIGVVEDQEDGTLSIDEKGTAYTEMVSTFEKHWYHFYTPMNEMVYGKGHPLSNISGGNPDVMRSMTAEDMWKFHKETHHLANMGVIVSIPDEIPIKPFLKKMSKILKRCQDYEDSNPNAGIGAYDFPSRNSAPIGTMKLVGYPSEKTEDPGYIMYGWPADLELDYLERFVLELFLETFASGETSNLYNLFINSQTRRIYLGGNYVFSGLDSDFGYSIYFGLSGVDNTHINEVMLDSVKAMIIDEIKLVYGFADGSGELQEFNTRVRNRLIQNKKRIDNYLNSPPMFGFRSGAGSGWLSILKSLEEEDGFHKSMVFESRFAYVEKLLSSEKNIWKDLIDHWGVLKIEPYTVGASPDPGILTSNAEEKEERLANYIEEFKSKYKVTDEQQAIAKYKEEFDKKTAELEAIASSDELPGFIDNPPLTLDDQLKYEVISLPNGIPLVASTFDNMTASKIGIALKLDVVPESLLVYVPYLPSILTDIGVYRDGEVIAYDEMIERLRKEVLSLNAYFSHGLLNGRVEIVLAGRGNNLDELENALGWLDAALYSPYLSEENLPRMLDLIDQSLISYRNTMKRSEEAWVRYPASAYRYQNNPLILSTNCFLTETHHYQRLKWLLTDPGTEAEQKEITSFLKELADYGKDKSREQQINLLTAIENIDNWLESKASKNLRINILDFSEKSKASTVEIAKSLKVTLSNIPNANLAEDWLYLCNEIKSDLLVEPAQAIEGFNAVLDLIRKTDNARMFMISNGRDRKETMTMIEEFTGKLDSQTQSVRQQYDNTNRILERLKSRTPGLEKPTYVGLINEGTRNGVLLFSAKKAGVYDTTDSAIFNCLSGKLYGGGGPHGLFMKTWAAGLAYSNGYSYRQNTGFVSYYAERCPDVSETMRFVVNELKTAEEDPGLTDYAVAQVFGYSRAPSRYEQRGEAMASDLIDGYTPEVVKAFRKKVLDFKDKKNLNDELRLRMESAYGPVLIGYGQSLSESKDGIFFLIGPEEQFKMLENYIETTEGEQTVYRLYPRDFWLTL